MSELLDNAGTNEPDSIEKNSEANGLGSSLLKFITCGSVDDGKSTLIGHILYDSKLLYADQEKALELSSRLGSREGQIDYSLLLDGLMAEREQGITIDVAYRYFSTDARSFIVADTPGHEEYTRNMAVGASFADLAVILIDATKGILVQTRRHARICAFMGIRYFLFAVNKMDLAGYSEERFIEITRQIEELSTELGLENTVIIPVSATEGDNVVVRSGNMTWYTGETVLGYLESVDIRPAETSKDFILPVQRVCRPNHTFRGFQGQIESGTVSIGDTLRALPGNQCATVSEILVAGKSSQSASVGQPVTICLSSEIDVSRGSVLVSENSSVSAHKSFRTTMLWMDDDSLSLGREYILKTGTRRVPAIISKIVYKIDINSGKHIYDTTLKKNEIACCEVSLAEKTVIGKFSDNTAIGSFILIDRLSHATSGCGVVDEVIEGVSGNPYFINGDIASRGFCFEEFYFNLGVSFIQKTNTNSKQYTVGDSVKLKGESFSYPESFDIICVEDKVAVLVRNAKIEDILRLGDYKFSSLPKIDSKGFALRVSSPEELSEFINEYDSLSDHEKTKAINKWTKFEVYRRIICTDNFWVI